MKVLVVGIGKSGFEHLKVLKGMKLNNIYGWSLSQRKRDNISRLDVDIPNYNFDDLIKKIKPSHVILAVPVDHLTYYTLRLLEFGIKNILIEKPGFIHFKEADKVIKEIKKNNANVYVGFNRRFYSSVQSLKKIMKRKNEEINSMVFEFNEVFFGKYHTMSQSLNTRNHWLLVNSLHIIDTVFFLSGLPDTKKSSYYHSGSLDWHKTGSIFVGAGLTENKVPYSYHSNWNGPGRWSFSIVTKSNRYIFNPIEELKVMEEGAFKVKKINVSNNLDINYKPGIFLQNEAFLFEKNQQDLLSYIKCIDVIKVGKKIGGYNEL